MKLRIERDALADAVAWAARTLPPRPTNPVLAGVLLVATEDRVSLSSSDLAVSSQVSLEADIDEPGDVVVSGRLLADIAKALPAAAAPPSRCRPCRWPSTPCCPPCRRYWAPVPARRSRKRSRE
jgi:hypothetical protein